MWIPNSGSTRLIQPPCSHRLTNTHLGPPAGSRGRHHACRVRPAGASARQCPPAVANVGVHQAQGGSHAAAWPAEARGPGRRRRAAGQQQLASAAAEKQVRRRRGHARSPSPSGDWALLQSPDARLRLSTACRATGAPRFVRCGGAWRAGQAQHTPACRRSAFLICCSRDVHALSNAQCRPAASQPASPSAHLCFSHAA